MIAIYQIEWKFPSSKFSSPKTGTFLSNQVFFGGYPKKNQKISGKPQKNWLTFKLFHAFQIPIFSAQHQIWALWFSPGFLLAKNMVTFLDPPKKMKFYFARQVAEVEEVEVKDVSVLVIVFVHEVVVRVVIVTVLVVSVPVVDVDMDVVNSDRDFCGWKKMWSKKAC